MSAPLRIQALSLPVGDLAPVEKFCRWALGMKPAEGERPDFVAELGWGNEDRVRVVDASVAREARGAEPDEAVVLRLPAAPVGEVAAWLRERALAPEAAAVSPEDEDAARQAWPEADVAVVEEAAARNRLVVSVRGPSEPRVDLFFPLPAETVARRGLVGPFHWRSREWRGLEVPGLLGVTTGTPDTSAARDFLARLGAVEPEEGEGPLAIGDHQWIVEERDPPGVYGYAVVVRAERVRDLARTMEHLGVDHRLEDHRLVAADPAGRIVLVHGVRGG